MPQIKGFYTAKPTLAELYADDPLLFNGLSLPVGMDDTTARSVILQELGDLQTVFPRASDCRTYIPIWCAANAEAWQRMYDALTAEYNPIHNYDRTDTETETVAGSGSETNTTGEQETIVDTQNSTTTGTSQAGGQDTTTHSRQGYNSTDYVPADREVAALGTKNDSSSATTGSGTQSRGADRNESRERSSAESRTRTLNSAGNIGVTTAQQMIEAEVAMRQKWTMYGIICEAFKRDFCVGVW